MQVDWILQFGDCTIRLWDSATGALLRTTQRLVDDIGVCEKMVRRNIP